MPSMMWISISTVIPAIEQLWIIFIDLSFGRHVSEDQWWSCKLPVEGLLLDWFILMNRDDESYCMLFFFWFICFVFKRQKIILEPNETACAGRRCQIDEVKVHKPERHYRITYSQLVLNYKIFRFLSVSIPAFTSLCWLSSILFWFYCVWNVQINLAFLSLI